MYYSTATLTSPLHFMRCHHFYAKKGAVTLTDGRIALRKVHKMQALGKNKVLIAVSYTIGAKTNKDILCVTVKKYSGGVEWGVANETKLSQGFNGEKIALPKSLADWYKGERLLDQLSEKVMPIIKKALARKEPTPVFAY